MGQLNDREPGRQSADQQEQHCDQLGKRPVAQLAGPLKSRHIAAQQAEHRGDQSEPAAVVRERRNIGISRCLR